MRGYRLLETLRAFGREELVAAGEEWANARQSARYFLEQAVARQRQDGGVTRVPFATWLGRERENLRAALAWLDEQGQTEEALQLCCAIYTGWVVRGEFDEGANRLGRLLAPSRRVPIALRARALFVPAIWSATGPTSAVPASSCSNQRRCMRNSRGTIRGLAWRRRT